MRSLQSAQPPAAPAVGAPADGSPEIPSRFGGGPRVALYSHDTQGLGHIRRNILVARALSRAGAAPVVLLLSGVREAAAFEMPRGVDCLTLPSIGKDAEGQYFPRSLVVSMDELVALRRETIAAALRSFAPDVLVVDKVPSGALDELAPSLDMLRARRRTRIVLGLREILDEPCAVRREWESGGYIATLRNHYDRIWVYGDPLVYDPAKAYAMPADIAGKTRFTGYLNPLEVDGACDAPAAVPERCVHDCRRLVLCVVGGGRDGLPLAQVFLNARLPADSGGLLVTGPLMSAEDRTALRLTALRRPRMDVLEFVTDPTSLMARADRVIAMGGYNTVCEILATGRPALLVPRVKPRREQLIRAERLSELGLVQMVHPDELSPAVLSRWLDSPAAAPRRGVIDMSGVSRLPALLQELVPEPLAGRGPVHGAV
jgi:predicted glycosyltransferase